MQANKKKVEEAPVVKIEEWLMFILLGLIPGVNLIVFGIFSFKKGNPNKRNFARAAFGFIVVLAILLFIGLFT